jgi:hypothetical protein
VLAQAQRQREQITEYEANQRELDEANPSGELSPSDPGFGSGATLRYGIAYWRLRLEWCEWLSNQLQAPQRPASRRSKEAPR